MRSIQTHAMRKPKDGVQVETIYLDLDGDGVPDAVHIVEAVAVVTGDGHIEMVEVVEELARDIGVDGVPRRVDVVDHAEIALEADGALFHPHRLAS